MSFDRHNYENSTSDLQETCKYNKWTKNIARAIIERTIWIIEKGVETIFESSRRSRRFRFQVQSLGWMHGKHSM